MTKPKTGYWNANKNTCNNQLINIVKFWFFTFLVMAIFVTYLFWMDTSSLFAQLFFLLTWFGTIAPIYLYFKMR